MVIETIAVALLATTISSPAIIPIQVVVIGIGALVTVGSQIRKKLSRKEGKHERIAVLAEGKLSAVSDRISKALDDGEISEEEYSLIVSELDKFREMKEEIRGRLKTLLRIVVKSQSGKEFHE